MSIPFIKINKIYFSKYFKIYFEGMLLTILNCCDRIFVWFIFKGGFSKDDKS